MQTAGYDIREIDPFESPTPLLLSSRELSPYVHRLRILWQQMRQEIVLRFPKTPQQPIKSKDYLHAVDEKYVLDAYNSLSIEGYRVSEELIKRTRSCKWNPDHDENDNNHRNALATRGYWQAFQPVKRSILKVMKKENAGTIAWNDHSD